MAEESENQNARRDARARKRGRGEKERGRRARPPLLAEAKTEEPAAAPCGGEPAAPAAASAQREACAKAKGAKKAKKKRKRPPPKRPRKIFRSTRMTSRNRKSLRRKGARTSTPVSRTSFPLLTTRSSPSPTCRATSSVGRVPARSASKVRAKARPMRRRWSRRMPPARRWATASRKSRSSLGDQAPAANLRSARFRRLASISPSSATSLPCRIMVAARRNNAASDPIHV